MLWVVSYFSELFQLLYRNFLWNENAENLTLHLKLPICENYLYLQICIWNYLYVCEIILISKSKHIITQEFFDFQFRCFLTIFFWLVLIRNMFLRVFKITSFCFLFFPKNKLVFLIAVSYKTYCVYIFWQN